MAITLDGSLGITTPGNVTVTSGGITFNANPGGGTQALLNDYEVGTFTPAITINGSTSGITYSIQAGYYVKIGRMAQVQGVVALSSKGGLTGPIICTGLPFAGSESYWYCAGMNAFNWASTNYSTIAQITSATQFDIKSSGTDSNIDGSSISNSFQFRFTFTYRVY